MENTRKALIKESRHHIYTAFTRDRIYVPKQGNENPNYYKYRGLFRKELHTLIELGVNELNKTNSSYSYKFDDFLIGFSRNIPFYGIDYDIYYKKNKQCCSIARFHRYFQPFSLETHNSNNKILNKQEIFALNENTEKQVINFVLPITSDEKNFKAFSFFLETFKHIAIDEDKSYSTLTIVFGYNLRKPQDLIYKKKVEDLVNDFVRTTGFIKIKLVLSYQRKYSRAKYLDMGVRKACDKAESECLVFLCDVDIFFEKNFLDFCRYNSIEGKKAYFPILFSLYNPNILPEVEANDTDTFSQNILASNQNFLTKKSNLNIVLNQQAGYW